MSEQYVGHSLFSSFIILQFYIQWRKALKERAKPIILLTRPKECFWLDSLSYSALVAVCDTFLPRSNEEGPFQDDLKACVNKFYPGLYQTGIFPNISEFHNNLVLGALDADIPALVALAFENCLQPTVKLQLFLLLKMLSSSLGCFLLTGNAAPFQV